MSVCSGIEAATVAWHPLGWSPVAFSEIDEFPCEVLRQRIPEIPNWGDLNEYAKWPNASFDVLVGGTPCFPAGTMIATDRGFVEIENVREGDMALTHRGRFRRVLRAGSKIAPTVVVKGQGHPGFVTTANHPFYARKRIAAGQFSGADWVRADSLAHHHWACVSKWPAMPVPPVSYVGREKQLEINSETLFMLAGAYLGDGWARVTPRRGYVYMGLNPDKMEALKPFLDCLRTYTVSPMRTSVRVEISSRPLARWLLEHFGAGAESKRVPMWALGLPLPCREAILRGYQITDGGRWKHGMRATTVSRQLALTARSLALSTGHASSVHFTPRPELHIIEGRSVRQRDTYTVSFSVSSRTSFDDGGFRWQLVRGVSDTARDEQVFDLEIEEDHSYVADGICVHNCQDFSIAGGRAGMAGERGRLTLRFLDVAGRYRPRWIVWENPTGVLSSNGGRDFGAFLSGLAGLGYRWAYRVLDAQFVQSRGFPGAVPQRRKRVFVVAYFGNWRPPAAVLFDRESLSGSPPPRRCSGEGFAGADAFGLAFRGREGGSNAEIMEGVSPALRASGGGGSRAYVLASGQANAEAAENVSTTLTCLHEAPIIAFDCKASSPTACGDGTVPTLRAMSHHGSHANAGGQLAVAGAIRGDWIVRRLSPLECERLMAFPDYWTRISWRGRLPESCPNGHRYKALGNSIAVNCLEWIGERIDLVESVMAEMKGAA